MKLKSGLVMREVVGKYMVINTGEMMNLNEMMELNETGKVLWECIEQGKDTQAQVQALMAEYDVDEALAKQAVESFAAQLKQNGLLED